MRLLDHVAAVDHDRLPREVARLFRSQVGDQAGDLVGRSWTPEVQIAGEIPVTCNARKVRA